MNNPNSNLYNRMGIRLPVFKWIDYMKSRDNELITTVIDDETKVVTRFTGIDAARAGDRRRLLPRGMEVATHIREALQIPPLVFETRVWGPRHGGFHRPWPTESAARAGHDRLVARLRGEAGTE